MARGPGRPVSDLTKTALLLVEGGLSAEAAAGEVQIDVRTVRRAMARRAKTYEWAVTVISPGGQPRTLTVSAATVIAAVAAAKAQTDYTVVKVARGFAVKATRKPRAQSDATTPTPSGP